LNYEYPFNTPYRHFIVAWNFICPRQSRELFSGVLDDIFTQGAIDAGLIALSIWRMAFEPVNHVGIKA